MLIDSKDSDLFMTKYFKILPLPSPPPSPSLPHPRLGVGEGGASPLPPPFGGGRGEEEGGGGGVNIADENLTDFYPPDLKGKDINLIEPVLVAIRWDEL